MILSGMRQASSAEGVKRCMINDMCVYLERSFRPKICLQHASYEVLSTGGNQEGRGYLPPSRWCCLPVNAPPLQETVD